MIFSFYNLMKLISLKLCFKKLLISYLSKYINYLGKWFSDLISGWNWSVPIKTECCLKLSKQAFFFLFVIDKSIIFICVLPNSKTIYFNYISKLNILLKKDIFYASEKVYIIAWNLSFEKIGKLRFVGATNQSCQMLMFLF